MTTAVATTTAADTSASLKAATKTQSKNEAGSADRFLKLLVAQMQNQDPLKPMDNAQVTSQMAQIQTVSGIEKLNKSIEGMSSSFSTLQSMQGASLVGRGVMLDGNTLNFDEDGVALAGFELDGAADNVTLEVLSGAGKVLDTVNMGAQNAGLESFGWKIPKGMDPALPASFRITAKAGAATVASTTLTHDRVAAVVTGGPTLMLELQNGGSVPYTQIKSFN